MASTSAIAPGCRREDPALPTRPVIAIANQKGGVGKTTSTVCLALALTRLGRRVLAVDCDPQASLTLYFGADPRALEAEGRTVYSLMLEDRPAADLVRRRPCRPSSGRASGSRPARASSSERGMAPHFCGSAWRRCSDMFDIILIDAMPSLGLLAVNALAAATHVLIPVKTDYLSLMGVSLLLETVDRVRQRLNPELELLGVLPTMFDQRNSHDREVLGELEAQLGGTTRLFPPVRRSTVFDQASVGGLEYLRQAGLPKVAQGYEEIARVLAGMGR